MEKDDNNEFIIRADKGSFYLKIEEVFGFPDATCHMGGYDTKSLIEINSSKYSARGFIYISTGQLFNFYTSLENCYKDLIGSASLHCTEGNLEMNVFFDGLGHASVSGRFKEDQSKENELRFEFITDQTYLWQAVSGLSDIVEEYGDNYGKKKS